MKPQNQNDISDGEAAEKKLESPVCVGCPDSDQCRKVWSAPNRGPFTAVGLSLSSILVFLLPLAGAIFVGGLMRAISEKSSTFREILAAVVGLVIGIGLARLLMPLIRKHFYVGSEKETGS